MCMSFLILLFTSNDTLIPIFVFKTYIFVGDWMLKLFLRTVFN